MEYQSPLGYNFNLEQSILIAKISKEEERSKEEEIKKKPKRGKKKKQARPQHPIWYSKPTKEGRAALSYFLMNPSTPEPLLNDKKIRPVKLTAMMQLEGVSQVVLRNVIREALCTCFNFFSPFNFNENIVDIVQIAIVRAWAAVDMMTYDSLVNEVGGLSLPGKKCKEKKNGAQVDVSPVPNNARDILAGIEKSLKTDTKFADSSTVTKDIMISPIQSAPRSVTKSGDKNPFYDDQQPVLFLKGHEHEKLAEVVYL